MKLIKPSTEGVQLNVVSCLNLLIYVEVFHAYYGGGFFFRVLLATSDQKKRAAQKKYRENNKEKRSLSKKVATLRRRLREKGMSLEAIEGAVRTITGDKPIGDAGYFSEKKELS